jgi:hypothetical protein
MLHKQTVTRFRYWRDSLINGWDRQRKREAGVDPCKDSALRLHAVQRYISHLQLSLANRQNSHPSLTGIRPAPQYWNGLPKSNHLPIVGIIFLYHTPSNASHYALSTNTMDDRRYKLYNKRIVILIPANFANDQQVGQLQLQ